jgi:hypothetical protein
MNDPAPPVDSRAAAQVEAILAPLPPRAALAVLIDVSGRVLASMQEIDGTAVPSPPRRRYLLGRAHPFRIDQDPEMKAFILGLSKPITIAALRSELITRFGAQRTPSKSAMHRYLQRLEGSK